MTSTVASLQRSARSVQTLRRATGRLATAATARMETDLPWFARLSAEERSWVGMIVQAGIRGFVAWYASAPDDRPGRGPRADVAATMYGVAPRALTGVISLHQTVDLVRLSIDVVETHVDDLLTPEDAPAVHAGIARYAREVAFATAEVYARAAEARGAWDARLEALVVDAVLRAEADEAVLSRASALGWAASAGVTVVLGPAPQRAESDLFVEVRHLARAKGLEALCAVQGDRLVVVLGGVPLDADARAAATAVDPAFGEGQVVAGPVTAGLAQAHASARAALAAHRASPGWPDAPRPALSDEYLPERVLAGDGHARRYLVQETYRRLSPTQVETLAAYFAAGGSLEGAARTLFVHVNTVRYRLRQVTETTGFDAGVPRDALTLQLALTLGRQAATGL